MSINETTEVKEIDEVVTPAEVDESTEPQDSSPEETVETEETEEEETPTEETAILEDIPEYGDVKKLPDETPREFAYRIEIARLREDKRKEQVGEIMTQPVIQPKKELSPEKKAVLGKYKPEDINTLKEVFDVMAEDMGFVRQDQLGAQTYQSKATEVLDDFLEKHPEYQPKNDPGNVLWERFKQEYSLYRPTQNPRDLKKILNKVHTEVFGIKPVAALNKQDATKEKIKVASHGGTSRPSPSREGVKRASMVQTGLRTDMLKGFTDEEIADLTGE